MIRHNKFELGFKEHRFIYLENLKRAPEQDGPNKVELANRIHEEKEQERSQQTVDVAESLQTKQTPEEKIKNLEGFELKGRRIYTDLRFPKAVDGSAHRWLQLTPNLQSALEEAQTPNEQKIAIYQHLLEFSKVDIAKKTTAYKKDKEKQKTLLEEIWTIRNANKSLKSEISRLESLPKTAVIPATVPSAAPATPDTKKQQETANAAPESQSTISERQRTTEFEQSRARQKAEKAGGQPNSYIDQYLKGKLEDEYHLDGKVGDMDQDEMAKLFSQMEGHMVVENIMMKPPFNLPRQRVSDVATTIVCGAAFNDNNIVEFSDIFDYADLESPNPKLIPQSLMKDPSDFLEKFDTLINKSDSELTKEERKTRDLMFTEVIVPCMDLLEAFTKLKTPEGGFAKIKTREQIVAQGLTQNPDDQQKEYLEDIHNLFFFSEKNEPSEWGEFINWIAGGEDEITMSTMDGKKFALDRGMFNRYYNASAAMQSFLEDVSELDAEGRKVIVAGKLHDKISETIRRGLIQMELQERMQGAKEPISFDTANFAIRDDAQLKEIAEGHSWDFLRKAFQLGFINEHITKFEKQTGQDLTTTEILEEATGPEKTILTELSEQGLPAKQLQTVSTNLTNLGAGGLQVHNGEVYGAGLGTDLDLGDGYKLQIAGAITKDGATPMLGLQMNIVQNENISFALNPGISLLGGGIDAAFGVTDGNGITLEFHAGVGIFGSVVGVGGGMSLDWTKAVMKEDKTEAVKKSGLTPELWDSWDTLSKPEKWAAIEQLDSFESIKAAMNKYKKLLTKDVVINMIDQYKASLTASEIHDKMNSTPLLPVGVSVGLGQALGAINPALAVIGGFKFQLGAVTVFIPDPTEKQRILESISDEQTKAKVMAVLAKAQFGELHTTYEETSGRYYYKPGSGLGVGVLTGSHDVDLSGFNHNIDATNESLAAAQVRLGKLENGRYKLNVLNDGDKDVELMVDPLIQDLAVIQDSAGNFILEGDIDDFVITRQRFEFPRTINDSNSSIRDVITISSSESRAGKRDDAWIREHSSYVFSKTASQEKYTLQSGAAVEVPFRQQNLVQEKEGIARSQLETKLEGYSSAELKAMESDVHEMRKALSAVTKEEYNKRSEVKEGDLSFTDKLEAMYLDSKFKKEFKKVTDNPEKILALIEKYKAQYTLENMTDLEKNEAVIFMLNEFFTTLAKEKSPNRTIRKELLRRRRWSEHKYRESFKQLQKEGKLPKGANPRKMADHLMDDLYDGLSEKLKDKDFNFQEAIETREVPAGSILLSGSRAYRGGKTENVFVRTAAFPETEGILPYGFLSLEGTEIGKQYDLNSANEEERFLAIALLDMASPIPKDDIEMLKSPLVVKLLSTAAFRLITTEENYVELYKIIENPGSIDEKGEAALKYLREIVQKMRDAEISGTPLVLEGQHGQKIIITMKPQIRSMAYNKCGNASHFVNETFDIQIRQPGNATAGVMHETDVAIGAHTERQNVTVSLFGGVSSTAGEDGKHSDLGPSTDPESVETTTTEVSTANGNTYEVTSTGDSGGSHSSSR